MMQDRRDGERQSVRRVCAWCREELGLVESAGEYAFHVTHGICDCCADKLFTYQQRPLGGLLDELETPVLALDGEGQVISANGEACALFGKERAQVTGRRGGEVMECIHSREPEGCGRTAHCSGCTIRRCVMETLAGAPAVEREPAFQHVVTPEGIKILKFLISTEKVKDHVLLRIECPAGDHEAGAKWTGGGVCGESDSKRTVTGKPRERE